MSINAVQKHRNTYIHVYTHKQLDFVSLPVLCNIHARWVFILLMYEQCKQRIKAYLISSELPDVVEFSSPTQRERHGGGVHVRSGL